MNVRHRLRKQKRFDQLNEYNPIKHNLNQKISHIVLYTRIPVPKIKIKKQIIKFG